MIPFPDKKYNLIYADPAWEYDNERTGGNMQSGAAHKYDVMSIDELKALPVQSITANPCICFMWGTWPKLDEARELMKAWGFEYKTRAFIWIKTNKSGPGYFTGMGFYTRGNDEFVLLGVSGDAPNSLVIDHGVSSLVFAPVDEHSKKPDKVRRRIVKMCGDLPRIELFARQKPFGWDAWGNEVEDAPILEQYSL